MLPARSFSSPLPPMPRSQPIVFLFKMFPQWSLGESGPHSLRPMNKFIPPSCGQDFCELTCVLPSSRLFLPPDDFAVAVREISTFRTFLFPAIPGGLEAISFYIRPTDGSLFTHHSSPHVSATLSTLPFDEAPTNYRPLTATPLLSCLAPPRLPTAISS